jgi:hypothetical protein
MAGTALQVLFNPKGFFTEWMHQEESLKVPGLIVLVVGIIGAISAAIVSNLTIAVLPAEAQAYGSVILVFSALAAILSAFVMWVIITVVFYVISIVFKGEGSFRRTLSFVGYGYLPQVFGGIIAAIFYYLWITTVQIPTITDPYQLADAITSLLRDPLLQTAGIVSILFMVWSANIWIFGIRYARNLSSRDAALTVGIPVALYILYTLINLFGWL